jgi:hypothetical protein
MQQIPPLRCGMTTKKQGSTLMHILLQVCDSICISLAFCLASDKFCYIFGYIKQAQARRMGTGARLFGPRVRLCFVGD